jgi:methylmalonyl-CoA mutase cobalamin-binding subunit
VLAVTFMIVEEHLRGSELVFSVLRVCDRRHNLISHHRTRDEAINAAQQYVMQAKCSGLDAAFLPVSGVPYAAEANGMALSF